MAFPWQEITWVLLDMDGTLLDKHFDDYFWETLVPQEYARRQGLPLAKPGKRCSPVTAGRRAP